MFSKKLEIIRELIWIEQPGEDLDYLHKHLAWSEEELRVYRDNLKQRKNSAC